MMLETLQHCLMSYILKMNLHIKESLECRSLKAHGGSP